MTAILKALVLMFWSPLAVTLLAALAWPTDLWPAGLLAGVGVENIATDLPSQPVHDPSYAKALVISDGTSRAADTPSTERQLSVHQAKSSLQADAAASRAGKPPRSAIVPLEPASDRIERIHVGSIVKGNAGCGVRHAFADYHASSHRPGGKEPAVDGDAPLGRRGAELP